MKAAEGALQREPGQIRRQLLADVRRSSLFAGDLGVENVEPRGVSEGERGFGHLQLASQGGQVFALPLGPTHERCQLQLRKRQAGRTSRASRDGSTPITLASTSRSVCT